MYHSPGPPGINLKGIVISRESSNLSGRGFAAAFLGVLTTVFPPLIEGSLLEFN